MNFPMFIGAALMVRARHEAFPWWDRLPWMPYPPIRYPTGEALDRGAFPFAKWKAERRAKRAADAADCDDCGRSFVRSIPPRDGDTYDERDRCAVCWNLKCHACRRSRTCDSCAGLDGK